MQRQRIPAISAVALSLGPAVLCGCAPVFFSLPRSQQADSASEYRTVAFTVRPPAGRWRWVGALPYPGSGLWSTGDAADLPILGAPDAVANFCKVRRFGVQIEAKGPDPLGSCLTITAYRASAPGLDRFGGDAQRITQVIAAEFVVDSGSLSTCGFWGNHWVNFRGGLDTLRIGDRTILRFRRLSADKRKPLCGEQPAVLLYVTKQWLYRFYLPDSGVGPGSQEWRVLESFQPIPNEKN